MVSLPFTCQLGPDGKYIRNYLVTRAYEMQQVGKVKCSLSPTVHNRPEIVLCYVPPVTLTKKMHEEYEKYKECEYFSMLLPMNDFIKK